MTERDRGAGERESTSDVRVRVHQLANRFDATIERGRGLAPLRREAVDVANRLLAWSDDE